MEGDIEMQIDQQGKYTICISNCKIYDILKNYIFKSCYDICFLLIFLIILI